MMYQLPVEAAQVRLHLNSIVLVNHPIPAIFFVDERIKMHLCQ